MLKAFLFCCCTFLALGFNKLKTFCLTLTCISTFAACANLGYVSVIIIFKAYLANRQGSTQTLSRRENSGLQWTIWQQKYFEKKYVIIINIIVNLQNELIRTVSQVLCLPVK